jgi:predicted nucleic acid-binding protein
VIVVPDASVALKWFFDDGERDLMAARELRRQVIAAPLEFRVPELFVYEMHAVFCRRLKTPRVVDEYMAKLWALGIPVVRPDEVLQSTATWIALEHGLTAYDASYAAVARAARGQWLTADAKAHRRLAGTSWSRLLGA